MELRRWLEDNEKNYGPHAKSWLIGKYSDAGRDWGLEEKGTTEDETAGWHHWLDERESEWTPGVGDRQGGLACFNSWGRKESNATERLNWTEVGKRELHNQANIMGMNLSLLNLFSLNQLNSGSKTSSFPQNPSWTLLGPSPWCGKLSFLVLWCQTESLRQSLGWSRQGFFCWLWWLLYFF